VEAAEERMNPLSAADDHASEVRLHQALVDHFGFSALGLSTYAFMNRDMSSDMSTALSRLRRSSKPPKVSKASNRLRPCFL
jgi:hypothetical protein